jgi:hypothetical protein
MEAGVLNKKNKSGIVMLDPVLDTGKHLVAAGLSDYW